MLIDAITYIYIYIYSYTCIFLLTEMRQKCRRSQDPQNATSSSNNIYYVLLSNFVFLSVLLTIVMAIGWILDITYTPTPCLYKSRPLTIYQAASTSAMGISNGVSQYSKLKVVWPPHVLSHFVIDR